MNSIPPMQEGETYIFYPTGKHHHTASKDLKRYPCLINIMLRHTLVPKVGNSDKVRFPCYEVIRAIKTGDKLNMIEWMAAKMVDLQLDKRGALVFQPYIMVLIRNKVDFLGVEEVVHKPFRPHSNNKKFLQREASPPSEAPLPLIEQPELDVAGSAEGDASVWAPLENYFVPYF